MELTKALFDDLLKSDYLFDEMATKARSKGAGKAKSSKKNNLFPAIYPSPPSSIKLPKKYKKKPAKKAAKAKKPAPAPILPSRVTTAYQALAIQIIPHHNGEIFLSKTAMNQSPNFFGFPFTGKTTPKIATNKSYPMREPDPSVLLTIYDATGVLSHQEEIPNLNTVFYEAKAEIRITINPTLAGTIPEYSILVMKLTNTVSVYDYKMEVYLPGSPIYDTYLNRCDQTMPSGGKPVSRRMGWL
jgi:hypothetical protein